MNELVELCSELLKKSLKSCFWFDKATYDYYDLQKIVEKLPKQFVRVVEFDHRVCVIVEVQE